jgi:hypothetical protein
LIFVNKRNVIKTAFSYRGELVELPATWTSKYGSITFNMNGHNSPTDGMNETGLIVTSLVLEGTEYPVFDAKPSVSLDQWIQYLLDNCATVDEVISACSEINIRYLPQDNVRLHFLVTDGNGQNAVLEFIEGQIIATTGGDLEKKVIANSTYESSMEYFNQGGNPNLPATASLNRFYNAAVMADAYNNEDIVDYCYSIMEVTAQRHTQRRIVYDITNRRIYLKSKTNEQLRYIDFSAFDFTCQAQALVYQESVEDEGDIRDKFKQYTTEINLFLTEISWQFLQKNYTSEELNEFVAYPETFECFYIDAGDDIETCHNYTGLSGNNVANYSGSWVVVAGHAIFDNSLDANTYARDLGQGENLLRWTLAGDGQEYFDDILVKNNHLSAFAGIDSSVETSSLYLYANEPQNGAGEWTLLEGFGVFENPNQYNTLVSNLDVGVNKFIWEMVNQNCSDSDTVEITYDLKSSVSSIVKSGFSIVVYPNPARENLYFKGSLFDFDKLKISIFDVKGNLVYSTVNYFANSQVEDNINVSSFEKGEYVIVFETNNFRRAQKFVKN